MAMTILFFVNCYLDLASFSFFYITEVIIIVFFMKERDKFGIDVLLLIKGIYVGEVMQTARK